MSERARTHPGEPPIVLVVSSAAELSEYTELWDELAGNALEPNPFYESWMLLPALERFATGLELRIALVLSQPKGPPRKGMASVLIGLFPLHVARPSRWLPMTRLALLEHDYNFFCAPLVHRDYGREALGAFLDWFEDQSEASGPLDLPRLPGDGPLHQQLLEDVGRRGWVTEVRDRYTRAVLRHRGSAEDYIARTVSGKRRKELRRQRKKLAEHGAVEFAYAADQSMDLIDAWIQEFARLEAAGWKGKEQTAFASSDDHLDFFQTISRAAARAGRLQLSRLSLGGQMIAAKLNLVAGNGAFAFRIAFDESFSRYSPGVLLEIDAIERFFASDLEFVDSCAARDHPMIDHLWSDRRTIEHLLISASRTGDLMLSVLPLARLARRALRLRKS